MQAVLRAAASASHAHATTALASALAVLSPPEVFGLACLALGASVHRGLNTPNHRWAARGRLCAAIALAVGAAEGDLLHAMSLRLLGQLLLLIDAAVAFGHAAAAAIAAGREAAIGLGGRFEVRPSKAQTAPGSPPRSVHADVGPGVVELSTTTTGPPPPPHPPPALPRLGARWPSPPRRISFNLPDTTRTGGFRTVR